MSTETKDGESTTRFAGWRRGVLWLLGAGALALVGYRGALGSDMVSGAVALPSAIAAENRAPGARASAERVTGAVESPDAARAPGTGSAHEDSGRGDSVPHAVVAKPPPEVASAEASAPSPAPAPDPEGGAEAPLPAGMTADGKVILNLATETELRKLPGIGQARARAIVEQRGRLGRFRRLEDLLRVKGIGPKRLKVLRPRLVLDAP